MADITSRSLHSTNMKVLDILTPHNLWNGKILDLGCGQGYLSRLLAEKLIEQGNPLVDEHLSACDLFPTEFKYDKIVCDRCDFNLPFPYASEKFDAVCSVEVIEHLENPFHFARELNRILKKGGVAVITTPNTMNLNSRFKAFVTGFPLLYGPLPISSQDAQDLGGHIHPVSFYYLVYMMKKAGFSKIRLHTDRTKRSAKLLLSLVYVPLKIVEKLLFRRMKKVDKKSFEENFEFLQQINTLPILLGRTVILELSK